MKEFSITEIRDIILNTHIVKKSDPAPAETPTEDDTNIEDENMYDDTTYDNSDHEEECVEADVKEEERNDSAKIIPFASTPSKQHPLDSIDRKVETPFEGMAFESEKEAIEFLFFFCR